MYTHARIVYARGLHLYICNILDIYLIFFSLSHFIPFVLKKHIRTALLVGYNPLICGNIHVEDNNIVQV